MRFADEPAECEVQSRAKDVNSATAAWFSELLSPKPWFKDVVPNVRSNIENSKDERNPYSQPLTSSGRFPKLTLALGLILG